MEEGSIAMAGWSTFALSVKLLLVLPIVLFHQAVSSFRFRFIGLAGNEEQWTTEKHRQQWRMQWQR
jgi:hypothetical protein